MVVMKVKVGLSVFARHGARGCSGAALNLASIESVSADIPMYCGPPARKIYIGDAHSDFTKRASDYWKLMTGGTFMDMVRLYWHSRCKRTMQIYNARAFETAEGLSKKDFFHKHGFVLLDHASAMTAEDWCGSEYKPMHAYDVDGTAKAQFTQGKTPVNQKYNEEARDLLKIVLPYSTEFKFPVRGIQRGPGSAYEKMYASVVHTDFPVDIEIYRQTNLWLGCDEHVKHFEEVNAASYYIINLWRPVLPMLGPVRSTPLAMLHPGTLEYDDLVRVDLIGGQFPEGQSYMHVQYRPEHKWFFYPDMRTDEVLVWKQAHFVKGERLSRLPVPHTAFKHPHAKDNEPRCSFEHRVAVYCSSKDGQ